MVSTIALFAALGLGGAYAADKIGSGDIANNAVRSKHIKNGQVKRADQARNQQTQWAIVKDDGTVIAQSGGISVVDDTGDGNYTLRFPGALGKRAIVATILADNAENGFASAVRCGTSPPGGAFCSGTGTNNQRHVYVNTRVVNGTHADHDFTVAVLPR